jgi:hypothetical protein
MSGSRVGTTCTRPGMPGISLVTAAGMVLRVVDA